MMKALPEEFKLQGFEESDDELEMALPHEYRLDGRYEKLATCNLRELQVDLNDGTITKVGSTSFISILFMTHSWVYKALFLSITFING